MASPSGQGRLPLASTFMPMAAAMRPSARPMRPNPTMPMVLPASPRMGVSQKQKSGQAAHFPSCTSRSCRPTLPQISSSSAMAYWATSWVP